MSSRFSELEFGLLVAQARQPALHPTRLVEIGRRVAEAKRLADQLVITRHVALEHARLRASYAKLVAPNALQSMSLKSKPVEMWHEDWRASNLQADENDLWIAATALAHDLTLVARDSGFEQIQKAAPTLKLQLLP